ncbi:MAG TPA: type VII secretion protein EccB [Actinophytocola sp.]|jgi:type VII secretion protein EccB|uniref:type VII secretion protein EccB n=1 Tax=Actinophytocola sp. TaxID=1872138 RepID=UPI002F94E663
MPSTPTTKSQVQAYRFVLRRMQSALVRKDAVMLHDPMRTHSRATIVGVCLAALGLLGFLIWGILSPKPTVPSKDGIVIGKPSGQVYVLLTKPTKRLIPVFNLASARLLLYAQTLDDDDSGKQTAAAPNGAAPSVVGPTVVDDNELRDQIPRDRKVGIPDGPDLLPSSDQRIDSRWTVCDQYLPKEGNTEAAAGDEVQTSVIAGVKDLGPELKTNQSLLVESENKDVYLVYRKPETANEPIASTLRAKVDMSQPNIVAALQLETAEPRTISTGLLNAIPEKAELKPPNIEGFGDDPKPKVAPPDLKVGSVFSVRPTGKAPVFYVVLRDGIQQIKRSTGDLIRYRKEVTEGIEELPADVIQGSNVLKGRIDDSTFPAEQTEVLQRSSFPVACLGWEVTGSGKNGEERTSVHVGNAVPGIPVNEAGDPKWVDISTPGSSNLRIDHFYMPPGRGAVVRQATSKEDFNSGPIVLVSDRGVKYGVPDPNTAAVLGLSNQVPAPLSILDLLPNGASLDPKDVEQSYDTVPIEPGEYPTKSQDPNGGGQAGGN